MAEIYEDTDNTEEPSAPLAPQDAMATGRVKLEAQIRALQDSLSRRSQMPFDPTLMALATGFLKPTQTGSFGESLGYAGEGAMGAAEKERARKSDLEKMKLELALKQYELTGDAEGQKMLAQAMAGAPASTVAASKDMAAEGAAATAAGSEGTPQSKTQDMSTEEAVETIKANPNAMFKITMNDKIIAGISKVSPKWGGVAQKIFDNQLKMAGVGQKQEELTQKGQESVKYRNPFDPSDTEGILVPRSKVSEYQTVLASGDEAKIRAFLGKIGTPGYIGAGKAPAGEAPKPLETKAEREQRMGKEGKKYEADLEQHKKDMEVLTSRGDSALNARNNAKAVYDFASNPETKGAFGVLAKPGILPAVLSAAQEGIKVGPYNIGIAGIEDAVRKAGGTQTEIDAATAVARNLSELELAFSQAFKGQGQVTENERLIVRQVGPKLSDSPKVAMLKSESVMARADFDSKNQELFNKWQEQNPNGLFGQYKSSPQYKALENSYSEKLGSVMAKYGMKPTAKPQGGGGSYYERLKSETKQ